MLVNVGTGLIENDQSKLLTNVDIKTLTNPDIRSPSIEMLRGFFLITFDNILL